MAARISAVAAIGRDRELGAGNRLIWKIPDDLKRFRQLTVGHPIIMGRKTFDSIIGYGGKPLPDRTNIVVTRDNSWTYPGVTAAHSIEDAIDIGRNTDAAEIFVIGGTQVFESAMSHFDRLHLTLIDAHAEADSFFPRYADVFTHVVFEENREWEGLKYTWLDLEK